MTTQFSAAFLSRYEPVRVLGEGGMGTVYLMRQTRLDRLVAVKVVRPDSLSVEECQRLQREAQVLASLDHPNILAVHDVDIDQDMPFLVTEYVEGETLSTKIQKKLSPDLAMKIVSQLLAGLKAAHRKGIIHRDLKPQNIFLTKQGKPKIGDFGLAKKQEMPSGTIAGAIMGSPPYMSPEQCRGFKATASSDLYSIGVMLFEMAVGVRPFTGPTLNDYLAQHTTMQAPWAKSIKADLPDGLAELLSRALEKDPARRFPSASVFRRDLMAIYRGSDEVSTPSSKSVITNAPPVPGGIQTSRIDVGSSEQVLLGERYRLERMVGEGGMGQVWLASDEAMDGQEVAIKILPPELWRDPEARENLKQEAKLSQRLSHPNVVRLMTLEPGEPAFLVMEYVPGPTLAAELIRRKFEDLPAFSPQEALPIIEGMCGALDLAHQKNLVHRDIKPANILLDPQQDGTFFPKLADFGIAAEMSNFRARRTGAVPAGTLAFMSPEQLACARIDGRADLYSLGATIFQMMTFSPPYAGGDVAWAVTNAPVPRPEGVPDKIADFIVRCLAKSADDRPANARELAREYRMALGLDPHEISWPSIDPGQSVTGVNRPRVTQGKLGLPMPDVESTMPGYIAGSTENTMNLVPGSDVERTHIPGKQRRRFAITVLAAMVMVLGMSSSRTGLLGRLKEQLFPSSGDALLRLPAAGEKVDLDRFQKAASGGNAEAMRLLGVIYREGRYGVPRDDKTAFGWFKRAVDANCVRACLDLGAAYARGAGVTKDDKLAFDQFKKAAGANEAVGHYNVGLFTRQGRAVKKDERAAIDSFKHAAELGSVPAMFQLGEMYLNGIGVSKDDKIAFTNFRKAAEKKNAPAQYLLGVMYAKGWGVERDLGQGIDWCASAASQGLPEAQQWMKTYAPDHH